MKLSIITVNLNNREGLLKTIDSVLAQTFRDFEWIVIDGGSSDGSRELIEEHASHFSYWVSEPDDGIYNAMNKGMAHASGEYCHFLNSGDCLAGEEVLEEVMAYFGVDGILYGDVDIEYKSGEIKNIQYPEKMSLGFLYNRGICHQASFIKRSLFDGNPYDESLKISSDWAFFIKQAIIGTQFMHIPKTICRYGLGGISDINFDCAQQERERITASMPSSLAIEEILVRRKTQSYLANMELEDFITLCGQHRIFGKILTFLIMSAKKMF